MDLHFTFSSPQVMSTSSMSDTKSTSSLGRMQKRRRSKTSTASIVDEKYPIISTTRSEPSVKWAATEMSEVLSQYGCPICLDYIRPPILMCHNAHLFCEQCRQHFGQQCPICREPLPNRDIRCFPMEQMAAALHLEFPCKHRSNGCPVSTQLYEKAVHENVCEFRSYHCSEVYGNCLFAGSRDALFEHLVGRHVIPHTEIEDQYVLHLKIVNDITGLQSERFELLTYRDHRFMSVLAKKDDTFNIFVVFIGEQREADRFMYRITLESDVDSSRMTFEGRPKTIRNGIRELVFFEEGLHFNSHVIRRCFKGNTNQAQVLVEIGQR